MNDLIQHIIVLAILAACVVWVVLQFAQTLGGRASRVGGCCLKGCGDAPRDAETKPVENRTQFISSDSLRRSASRPASPK
jgi:hypothetical protein